MFKAKPRHSPPLSSVNIIAIVFCKPSAVSRVDNQPSQLCCVKSSTSLSYWIAIQAISHFLSFFPPSVSVGSTKVLVPMPRDPRNAKHPGLSLQGKAICPVFSEGCKLEMIDSLVMCITCWVRATSGSYKQDQRRLVAWMTLILPVQLGAPPNSHSQDQKPKWTPCSLCDQDQTRTFPSPSSTGNGFVPGDIFTNYCVSKYVVSNSPGIIIFRSLVQPGRLSQAALGFHSHLSVVQLPVCRNTCGDPAHSFLPFHFFWVEKCLLCICL